MHMTTFTRPSPILEYSVADLEILKGGFSRLVVT